MNNIYFDKLPETIAKSSNEDDVNTTEVRMWFKSDVKISPLTDRLAEERKKVVLEIRNKVKQAKLVYEWKGDEVHIEEILDQIERGTDD